MKRGPIIHRVICFADFAPKMLVTMGVTLKSPRSNVGSIPIMENVADLQQNRSRPHSCCSVAGMLRGTRGLCTTVLLSQDLHCCIARSSKTCPVPSLPHVVTLYFPNHEFCYSLSVRKSVRFMNPATTNTCTNTVYTHELIYTRGNTALLLLLLLLWSPCPLRMLDEMCRLLLPGQFD